MGILKIKGAGRVCIMPDQVIISGKLKALSKNNYEEAVLKLSVKVNAMTELSAGGEKVQYTTDSFSVDVETEYTDSKRVFKGYAATYRISITLKNDREIINELLAQLIPLLDEDSLGMDSEISNEEQYQKQALELAIADARQKAEIICAAAGQKLGEIQRIFYNVRDTEGDDYITSAKTEYMASKSLEAIAIQSKEIEVREQIVVEWNMI
ncbi:MAG: SIMPL domain-containing protein [Bacteroidota bacterium]